jgi:hypothetical protein
MDLTSKAENKADIASGNNCPNIAWGFLDMFRIRSPAIFIDHWDIKPTTIVRKQVNPTK